MDVIKKYSFDDFEKLTIHVSQEHKVLHANFEGLRIYIWVACNSTQTFDKQLDFVTIETNSISPVVGSGEYIDTVTRMDYGESYHIYKV